MVENVTPHVLDPHFQWAMKRHDEAMEQPGFHGEGFIRFVYTGNGLAIVERSFSDKVKIKPTN